MTCTLRFGNAAAHVPRCTFDAGVPGEASRSLEASSWNVVETPRSPVASPRVSTNGTETVAAAGFRHRPAPFAATLFAAGAAEIVSV